MISGNGGNGVQIFDANSSGNIVQGNYIGLEANGQTPLGNAQAGVALGPSSGPMAANRILSNVISQNAPGISIVNAPGAHVIHQNVVGLAADGITARPNSNGIYVYLGETPQDAVALGWAHGALLATYPGDTTMATLEQVRAFANGGSARVQR